jgi:hypothetical protein
MREDPLHRDRRLQLYGKRPPDATIPTLCAAVESDT